MSQERMNPEVKAAWVKDLRETDAKQCKNRLKRGGAFCVMGRLCELHRTMTGEGEWSPEATFEGRPCEAYIIPSKDGVGSTAGLPYWVEKWAGLATFDRIRVKARGLHLPLPLPFLNDEGRTFAELADLIEEQL